MLAYNAYSNSSVPCPCHKYCTIHLSGNAILGMTLQNTVQQSEGPAVSF